MKRILVADLPVGVRTLEKVLGPSAEIIGSNILEEAVSLLRKGVDLTVCGIHFNESRMFDLLRMAKADRSTRAIPFLCYRDMDSGLPFTIFESMQISCKALGAAGFVDLFHIKSQFGIQNADKEFRRILIDLLMRSND